MIVTTERIKTTYLPHVQAAMDEARAAGLPDDLVSVVACAVLHLGPLNLSVQEQIARAVRVAEREGTLRKVN